MESGGGSSPPSPSSDALTALTHAYNTLKERYNKLSREHQGLIRGVNQLPPQLRRGVLTAAAGGAQRGGLTPAAAPAAGPQGGGSGGQRRGTTSDNTADNVHG